MKAKKLALAFPLIVLLALLVAGCGSSGSSDDSATNAADTVAGSSDDGSPTKGGVAKLATIYDLDPPTFLSGTDSQGATAGLVYDTLIDYTPDSLDPQPQLATSWKVSPDGKSVTLQLRDDVKFHNGRPFTSKDVQFSIEQYADPARVSQFQRTAAGVTGFDTSKPNEITLELAHPMGNIFDLLSTVAILDSTTIDEFDEGKNYVGTGAFKFVSWTPGTKIVYAANPDYWGGAPNLDGVELDIVPDVGSQVSQLRAGQVDGIFNAGNRDIEALEQSGQFEVVDMVGAERQLYVGANVANPALEDVKLRQAIAYAVDRDRIASDVYRGLGEPISLPWPDYSPAYSAEKNATYQQDIAKAKDLVAQVGDVPALPLAFMAGVPNFESAAQIVQSDLAAVGIEVSLEPIDAAQFVKQLIGGELKALWITEHGFAQYTPSTLTVSAYPFNAEKNSSNYVSKSYQAATDKAWKVVDGTSPEAIAAYGKLSDELLDSLFLIELVGTTLHMAVSPDLHDVAWSKRNEIDLSKAYLEG